MGEFFRDYGTQLALAIAGLATIISLVIGNYFKDNPRAGFILVAASVALIVLGNGASFYTQYQNVLAANAEMARHIMIREGIGRCIASGRVIMSEFGANKMPIPIPEQQVWVGTVDNFLHVTLGDSYVARFNNVGGPWAFTINGSDKQHNDYYADMYLRLTRLEEFSHELP
jgi:hypothetical protein